MRLQPRRAGGVGTESYAECLEKDRDLRYRACVGSPHRICGDMKRDTDSAQLASNGGQIDSRSPDQETRHGKLRLLPPRLLCWRCRLGVTFYLHRVLAKRQPSPATKTRSSSPISQTRRAILCLTGLCGKGWPCSWNSRLS